MLLTKKRALVQPLFNYFPPLLPWRNALTRLMSFAGLAILRLIRQALKNAGLSKQFINVRTFDICHQVMNYDTGGNPCDSKLVITVGGNLLAEPLKRLKSAFEVPDCMLRLDSDLPPKLYFDPLMIENK